MWAINGLYSEVGGHTKQSMKRIIPTLFLLVSGCSSIDTSDKTFDDTFKAFVTAVNNSQYEESLKYIPSQTFEKVSREQVIEYLKEAEQTIGQTRIQQYEFIRRGPVLFKRDSIFRKIRYKSIVVNYSNRDTLNPAAVKYLSNIYGMENIKYDSTERLYIINQVKDLIFMKSKESNWTFLELDSTKEESKLTKRLVPADILRRL